MRITPPPPIDITQVFPELADKAKQTVRLHPRRGPEPAPHESKMGGLFLWPAVEPWPVCTELEYPIIDEWEMSEDGEVEIIDVNNSRHNDAFIGVLQIRAEDVPELQFPYDKNLFQLLWCPRDHVEGLSPVCKVFWRKAEEIKNPISRAPTPKYPEPNYLPFCKFLGPEKVTEYPSVREIPRGLDEKLQQWQKDEARFYEFQLSTAPGTKLFGYVNWIQSLEIPLCEGYHEMEHLLTIDSAERGGGYDERWCPIEDQLELEQTQSGSNKEIETIYDDDDHDFIIGRDGRLYLFICRKCREWPIKWVLQGG